MKTLLRRIARLAWHFARRTEVAQLKQAWAFVRRVWSLGVADRVVLLSLPVLAALASLTDWPALPPQSREVPVALAHVGFLVLAWSVTLASAAAQSSPLALAAVAPWLVFYQVLVCGAWIGTPVVAAPIAWLTWVFFVSVSQLPSPWRRAVWWLVASAALGYVASGPSGLRRFLGWPTEHAQALLGSVVAALGGVGLILSRRRGLRQIGFAATFAGAVLITGATVVSSAWRNWPLTVDWVRTVFTDAGALVVLFWLWTSGSFAASSLQLAGWAVRRTARLAPSSWIRPVIVTAVALALVWDVWGLTGEHDPLERGMLVGHVAAGLGAAAALAWMGIRRRLSSSRSIVVFTWWAVAWLAMTTLHGGSLAVIDAAGVSRTARGVGLLIVVVGLALELGAMERDWAHASPSRSRSQLGLVALSVSCASVLSTVPDSQWETSRQLMVLAGMLHLAVPLALYASWRRRVRPGTGLDTLPRVVVFATGYATALGILAVEPSNPIALLTALPAVSAVMLVLGRTRPALAPAAGALAGALFGGGLIAGWMMPYPPTIPFLPQPPWINALRDWGALGRPPLSGVHLSALVLAWAAGAGVGWLTTAWLRVLSPRAPTWTSPSPAPGS